MSSLALFAWGSGSSGQLASSAFDDFDRPTLVSPPTFPTSPSTLRAISGGGGHSLFIFSNGDAFACGQGDRGQLGLPEVSTNISTPALILPPVSVFGGFKAAAAGWEFSLLLDDGGQVFSSGHNRYGQLGRGSPLLPHNSSPPEEGKRQHLSPAAKSAFRARKDRNSPTQPQPPTSSNSPLIPSPSLSQGSPKIPQSAPTGQNEDPCEFSFQLIPNLSHITHIACGLRHAAAINDEGHLFTWGEGKFGQLGLGTMYNEGSPRLVEALRGKRIAQVSCGARHTICFAGDGEVFTWGDNRFGQLGLGLGPNEASLLPRRVPGLETATIISCGWNHSVVLDQGGIKAFGRNSEGQLGVSNGQVDVTSPTVSFTPQSKVKNIDCGSEHTMVLLENGELYTVGWNEHGQLGLGGKDSTAEWKVVGPTQFSDIAAGDGFCYGVERKK